MSEVVSLSTHKWLLRSELNAKMYAPRSAASGVGLMRVFCDANVWPSKGCARNYRSLRKTIWFTATAVKAAEAARSDCRKGMRSELDNRFGWFRICRALVVVAFSVVLDRPSFELAFTFCGKTVLRTTADNAMSKRPRKSAALASRVGIWCDFPKQICKILLQATLSSPVRLSPFLDILATTNTEGVLWFHCNGRWILDFF